jgi:tetratricopeptide (TPR) repeat protein
VSVAHNKLGDVYFAVGALVESLNAYGEALDIYRRLAAQVPESVQFARDTAFTLTRLGLVYRNLFDHETAIACYQEGLAIDQRLAESAPDSMDAIRDVAVGYQRLADVYRDLNDVERALPLYERQLQITEAMAAQAPENANYARDLWVSYWRVARLLDQAQNANGADRWWRRAHDSLNQMIERGLFVSEEDRRFLPQMKARLGLA